jgi:hypothetical protein
MEGLREFALAVVVANAAALLAFILKSRLPNVAGRRIGWLFMPAILICPLFIPADQIGLRALAAFLVNEVAMKVVDYCSRGRNPSLRDFLWFLIPFPSLAVVFSEHNRRLLAPDRPWPHIARLIVGSLVVTTSFLLLHQAKRIAVLQLNFALDHTFKVLLFIPTIEAISRVLFALERLAGFDTKPMIRNAFLARTPAEFWRRYNHRVHDWLFRNVFIPSGGARKPFLGVVIVFVFSSVFHELMFGIATSVFDGCQLLFFLLQIPAVLASGSLERIAKHHGVVGKIFAHAVTILFLAVTSVLFFKGVSRVFPFVYANPW